MIHHFKDYIIKAEDEFATKSHLVCRGYALAAINRYQSSPINKEERAALAAIRGNIMAYMKALYVAE